jgi:hypothetical protein
VAGSTCQVSAARGQRRRSPAPYRSGARCWHGPCLRSYADGLEGHHRQRHAPLPPASGPSDVLVPRGCASRLRTYPGEPSCSATIQRVRPSRWTPTTVRRRRPFSRPTVSKIAYPGTRPRNVASLTGGVEDVALQRMTRRRFIRWSLNPSCMSWRGQYATRGATAASLTGRTPPYGPCGLGLGPRWFRDAEVSPS